MKASTKKLDHLNVNNVQDVISFQAILGVMKWDMRWRNLISAINVENLMLGPET